MTKAFFAKHALKCFINSKVRRKPLGQFGVVIQEFPILEMMVA